MGYLKEGEHLLIELIADVNLTQLLAHATAFQLLPEFIAIAMRYGEMASGIYANKPTTLWFIPSKQYGPIRRHAVAKATDVEWKIGSDGEAAKC